MEKSSNAERIKKYLFDRGYSDQDIDNMELGFIPGQKKLFEYLVKKGFSKSTIDQFIKIGKDTRIGTTHNLTIPYRVGSTIKGFKFRTVGNHSPKYINSSGLDKLSGFFNISA